MAGTYTLSAADIGKGKQYIADIIKLELRANGEGSDQYQSTGRIEAGQIKFDPIIQMSAGKVPNQLGVAVSFTVNGIVTGDAMRGVLKVIDQTITDARLTDINGHTWTLGKSGNLDFDCTVAEEISGDAEGSRKFTFGGGGVLTMAAWDTAYSAGA